jgi:hypothetical protein
MQARIAQGRLRRSRPERRTHTTAGAAPDAWKKQRFKFAHIIRLSAIPPRRQKLIQLVSAPESLAFFG